MRKIVDTITRYVLVFLMGAIVVDVVWQVFSRYVLQSPSSFTDELARYLLIWVSLLGGAYIAGKNEHISIDVLPDRLNPQNRFYLDILINVLIIFFTVTVLVIGGSYLMYLAFLFNQVTSSLSIGMGWIYLIGPISGLLVTYYKIDDIIQMVRTGPPDSTEQPVSSSNS